MKKFNRWRIGTRDQVWAYIHRYEVTYNPLYDQLPPIGLRALHADGGRGRGWARRRVGGGRSRLQVNAEYHFSPDGELVREKTPA